MYDIIVIGAGTAGMTAALYSARSNKSVFIIEREAIGGQIAESPSVENWPSIKEISGLDLSTNLFEQITALGCVLEVSDVKKVEKIDDKFRVTLEDEVVEATAVIIASGTVHRHLGIPTEEKYVGKGVSYCAVCDGPLFKGQSVSVIGDGNTAFQYALTLSAYASHVTLATRHKTFGAEETLVDRVKNNDKITLLSEVSLKEFQGEASLDTLVFEKDGQDELIEVKAKACFIGIGMKPDNERYENLVELNNGYIVVDEHKQTKTPGLYAAGDCIDKAIRQLTTAVNDGTIAAINAIDYVESK